MKLEFYFNNSSGVGGTTYNQAKFNNEPESCDVEDLMEASFSGSADATSRRRKMRNQLYFSANSNTNQALAQGGNAIESQGFEVRPNEDFNESTNTMGMGEVPKHS